MLKNHHKADFSNNISKDEDRLDFSGLKTLTPREDSWSKICARLDAEPMAGPAGVSIPAEKRENIIPFRILSAIPLAASIALVALSILMTAFSQSSETISISTMTSTEVASWYDGLGNANNESDDDFETLDNYATLSYLLQEDR